MAESPPSQGGALPESRDPVEGDETEVMDFEASVLALSLLSGGEEEGEVHSADELFHEPVVQALLSVNAAAEGEAGRGEQALREAPTTQQAVPLEGGAGRDQQGNLAVRTKPVGPSSHASRSGGVVPGNVPVVDNYLRID